MKSLSDKVLRLLGVRIAELRKVRGITQEELAERSDIDARYLQRIEAGEKNVSVDTLVKISSVLHATMASLFAKPSAAAIRNAGKPSHKPKSKKRPNKQK